MQCDVSQSEGSEENKTKKKKKIFDRIFLRWCLPISPCSTTNSGVLPVGEIWLARWRCCQGPKYLSLLSSLFLPLSLSLPPHVHISLHSPRDLPQPPAQFFLSLHILLGCEITTPHSCRLLTCVPLFFSQFHFFCFYYPSDGKAGDRACACACEYA